MADQSHLGLADDLIVGTENITRFFGWVETRHMRAALKAQINKTDRNDARGILRMMRTGHYRPVLVKTLGSQKLRIR